MNEFETDLVDRISAAAKEFGVDSTVVQLAERLVSDKRPRLEHAYSFGQTRDNEPSMFQAAAKIQMEGLARTFWVIDGAAADGFPGYDAWHEGLGRLVGYENVSRLLIPEWVQNSLNANGERFGRNANTFSESRSLVDLAKEEGIRHAYALSIPLHFLRAYMTAASEAIDKGGGISIFAYLGEPQPWDEVVAHSQGISVATRAEHVRREMKRIRDYSRPPFSNMRSVREILEYMDRRTIPPAPQPLNR